MTLSVTLNQGLVMIIFRLPELLLEKERERGCRIPWREVAEATSRMLTELLPALNTPTLSPLADE